MRPLSLLFLPALLATCLTGCGEGDRSAPAEQTARFALVPPEASGVTFSNTLTEGPNTNVLMYEYFYNGGGVAAADFNQDGLTDLYFTSSMGDNRLYLNEGDWKFRNVTDASQAGGRSGPWKTGVAVADVNADGLPDLYLSYSGMLPPEKRRNQLFINQGAGPDGVPVFNEEAARYGLDLMAFTNQAYFFDYDQDGDLDALLLNHNPKSLPILNVEKTRQLLATPDPDRGLRLMRNDGGRFTDVTEAAGINGSALSYGLGVALSDLNGDGLTDVYVSNDYEVPDYLYYNNGDGTFTDRLAEQMGHTSHFSMGSDVADINNDGHPDLFSLDMLPADNRRRKLLMADDNRSKHELNRASGWQEQNMRNMLQLNRGNGTFAEIGQLAGVAATDWSWSALLADLDNDGYKDLHVTNGYVRDYTNMDFIKYMEDFVAARGRLQRTDVRELVNEMPASDVSNFVFRNGGNLRFQDVTREWGLERPSNSNGAVTVDLDNDGDLDLVTNNLNQPAFLYRNDSPAGANHYLQVELRGPDGNPAGIGASVTINGDSTTQLQELFPNRGFLSSGPFVLHFGLGARTQVRGLTVRWPDGRVEQFSDVPADQRFLVEHRNAAPSVARQKIAEAPLLMEADGDIVYRDPVDDVRDFDRQPLLPRQLSHSGPVMATGDLNGDGLADLLIGGNQTSALQLFLTRAGGGFAPPRSIDLPGSGSYRVTDLAITDLDGDDQPDVYVARGGYHQLTSESDQLKDVLLHNAGAGKLEPGTLPASPTATGCVAAGQTPDGAVVFVGGQAVPGRYPEVVPSYLLRFGKNAAPERLPVELPGGIPTDATWSDLDGDGQQELIVVGRWMPLTVLAWEGGTLSRVTERYFSDVPTGWYNVVHVEDLTGDGRPDILVGNEGENQLFNVSEATPAELYAADLDRNGSVDPILSYYNQGEQVPDPTRDELLGQLSGQRVRFPDYRSYSVVTTADLLSPLDQTGTRLRATDLATRLYLQGEDGTFTSMSLPVEAQFAPVHAILSLDANDDGHRDLILAGNELHPRLRYGPSDANPGLLLAGDGTGNFTYVSQSRSGLDLRGAVRAAVTIDRRVFFGSVGGAVTTYQIASAR
ncbi:VCBS repeat-containing protein [Lewinella sp. IMCC34183]|uniref:VCBS repeat-containing protein n=1 Tax=Lewinella sp. IMCC34183 TaxID=2248762 RepID=UPI0018E56971|nr:VCBS repeat-containing protein [Lewinella sp. IMCC34183]